MLSHKQFTKHKDRPTYEILKDALQSNSVCDLTLNSKALRNEKGFALHRVVILDANDTDVTYHDPWPDAGSEQKTSKDHFIHAWLESVDNPMLTIYSK